MLLLTEYDRMELRNASSGLTPYDFSKLSKEEKEEYTKLQDKVIFKIMKRNPGAFRPGVIEDFVDDRQRLEERKELNDES
jgi:hypothetical protein